MIIGTYEILQPGAQGRCIIDGKGGPHGIPCLVLRRATYVEWAAEVYEEQDYARLSEGQRAVMKSRQLDPRMQYYEVSVD